MAASSRRRGRQEEGSGWQERAETGRVTRGTTWRRAWGCGVGIRTGGTRRAGVTALRETKRGRGEATSKKKPGTELRARHRETPGPLPLALSTAFPVLKFDTQRCKSHLPPESQSLTNYCWPHLKLTLFIPAVCHGQQVDGRFSATKTKLFEDDCLSGDSVRLVRDGRSHLGPVDARQVASKLTSLGTKSETRFAIPPQTG